MILKVWTFSDMGFINIIINIIISSSISSNSSSSSNTITIIMILSFSPKDIYLDIDNGPSGFLCATEMVL